MERLAPLFSHVLHLFSLLLLPLKCISSLLWALPCALFWPLGQQLTWHRQGLPWCLHSWNVSLGLNHCYARTFFQSQLDLQEGRKTGGGEYPVCPTSSWLRNKFLSFHAIAIGIPGWYVARIGCYKFCALLSRIWPLLILLLFLCSLVVSSQRKTGRHRPLYLSLEAHNCSNLNIHIWTMWEMAFHGGYYWDYACLNHLWH